jgi:hypothetical protein
MRKFIIPAIAAAVLTIASAAHAQYIYIPWCGYVWNGFGYVYVCY